MTDDHTQLIRASLPRPTVDPAFRRELLDLLLSARPDAVVVPIDEASGRVVLYLGGAVVGAVALVGAAVGWRYLRSARGEKAA